MSGPSRRGLLAGGLSAAALLGLPRLARAAGDGRLLVYWVPGGWDPSTCFDPHFESAALDRDPSSAPLSAALLRGEKELEALIAEVSPPNSDEDRARGLAFLEGLVADARPGLDPAECAAQAQLLTELAPLLAHRNGADPDAFAARLAALLAQGVAARP